MSNKKNICIIFGGRSGEHEVSIRSARSIYQAIDKDRYNVYLLGITKKGGMQYVDYDIFSSLKSLDDYIGEGNVYEQQRDWEDLGDTDHSEESNEKWYSTIERIIKDENAPQKIDVFFPIIHGSYGEDGCLQGFLEMLNAAYVGPGVLGSAVGMDKDMMKKILKVEDIPIGEYLAIRRSEYNDTFIDQAVGKLNFPMFVKPSQMGSSVGVSKVEDTDQLKNAIEDAFAFDTKVLVEEYIKGREIEVSVLGNNEIEASVPGEVIPNHDFYSYEAKYIDDNGAGLKIPAELDEDTVKKIQSIAIKTFKVLDCYGLSRVDMFLTENGEIYLNEINTLPGFTSISMYPKLWEVTGVSYPELINRLIDLAVEKKQEKDSLVRSYGS